MKILTQKGEHSCKYTELSLKRKERVVKYWYFEVMDSRHVGILVTYLISFIFFTYNDKNILIVSGYISINNIHILRSNSLRDVLFENVHRMSQLEAMVIIKHSRLVQQNNIVLPNRDRRGKRLLKRIQVNWEWVRSTVEFVI